MASVDGPLPDDTITYSYDALGRVASRAINGVALALTYDALGRVTQEGNVLGTFAYGYDGVSGRLASVTYPNGQTSTYGYLPADQDRRLQTIHHRLAGGVTLSKFDYTYDAVGNILTWQQQAGSAAPTVWRYGYDRADQLTSAREETTAATPQVRQRLAYGYDPAGNRVFEQMNDGVTAWSHDALNRLVAQAGGGVLQVTGTVNEPAAVTIEGKSATVSSTNQFTGGLAVAPGTNVFTVRAVDASGNAAEATYEVDVSDAPKTFTYDANGNLTSDGITEYEWDVNNRLVKITAGSDTTDILVDGRGRPVQETHRTSGVVTNITRLLFCGNELCRTTSSTAGETFHLSTYATMTQGIAQYQTRDHLGSVRDLSAADGSVIDRFAYSPFGRLTSASDASASRFATYRTENGSNRWLTWHRAYDAELGRWLSIDPHGTLDGPNLYTYVSNNPLKWIDPLGLSRRPTTTGPNDGRNNTTVCDSSGKITEYIVSMTAIQDRCLGACILTHEVIHYADLMAADPLACAGANAGDRVTFTDPNAVRESERKACRATFQCLGDKARQCRDCQSTIDNYINRVLRSYCAGF